MKLQRRWAAAVAGGALTAVTTIVLTAGGAGAAGSVDPAITADPNAANGTISFYDDNGTQITTGPLESFAKYAVASSDTERAGTIKASLFVATPDHSKTDSLQWFNQGLTAASVWPTSTAPANINAAGAKVPVVTISSTNGDGNLNGAFISAVNDPTTGYDHVMQVRLEDSGPGKQANAPFWATDVYIDTTADTWTQLYPAAAAQVATAVAPLTASPVSPAAHGTSVTFSSTVSAADSTHPAGAVHLYDGSTDLGAATFAAGTGAVSKSVTPTDGAHSFSFAFVPSASGYTGSTSVKLAYSVSAAPVAVVTTTSLAVSPAGSATAGDPVTVTASISPAAAGTVQFSDGSTALGTPVTVAGGHAAITSTTLAVGSHSFSAAFTPTDPTAFSASASAKSSYTINPVPATTTSTQLAVSPQGPVTVGDPVSLTATVGPVGAVGSVTFFNGTTNLGSSAVTNGVATKSVSNLPAGTAALTAKFTATDPTMYGTSTSTAVTLLVKAPAVQPTVTVTATPATAFQNAAVTLAAKLSVPAATGMVQFFDGAAAIGSPVAVSAASATLSTSFTALGAHSITATFTSEDTSAYLDSTSTAVTVTINAPAAATTTSLFVTPTGPADFGSPVDLNALVTPTAATGAVQFRDGTTKLGGAVALSGGDAALTVSTLAAGAHSFTATFVPADAAVYAASVSAAMSYQVNKPPAALTSTVLATAPAGEVSAGSALAVTATLTPATAVGSVEFFDGTTSLGTAAVAAGKATLSTSALAIGEHSLTAAFTPADATDYLASTSAAAAVTVKAAATVGAVTSGGNALTPGAELVPGQTLTISAAGFVPGETVSVVVRSTPTTVATAQADLDGAVTVTFTLPAELAAGSHTITLVGALDKPSFAFTVAAAASSAPPATPSPSASSSGAGSLAPSLSAGTATPSASAVAATAGSGGSLASTGARIIPAAVIALLLLAGGAFLATANRRRAH